MTEQFTLVLSAASVGFVAAVFFCIGSVMNSPSKILLLATPFWDFSEPIARALSSQRAQYITGSLLLVVSFLLQIAAALADSSTSANLPPWLNHWPFFVFAILFFTGLIAGILSLYIDKITIKKTLRLENYRRREDEN